jgi:dipeptidyl aminopeptidase/acylaminoacyl peptidase
VFCEFLAISITDRTASCTYTLLSRDKLMAAYIKEAASRLIIIDPSTGSFKDLQIPVIDLNFNGIRRVSDNSFTIIGSTETSPSALYLVDIQPTLQMRVLKSSTDVVIPSSLVSKAVHISAPRLDGCEDRTYALYNPPNNPNYFAPKGTLPPAIMLMHGGPTSQSTPGLSLAIQYWTSRGYAVVQVNYVGSSGYGRAYRDILNGNWGISDVGDAASVAGYLGLKGYIDPNRIGIVGGSSGGYVALQALCNYPKVWAGGISLYGISGLEILYNTTHKFEAHYMDYLLFGGAKNIDDKEKEALFHDRSPCYHADKIKAPTLLLQGSDDKVVPPSQAIDMEKSIKENGGDVRLVMFDGEGHGFRKAPNVLKSKEEEEAWWIKTLVRLAKPSLENKSSVAAE